MKRPLIVVLVLAVASPVAAEEVERREEGNLVIENVPEIPEALSDRFQQYQEVRSASLEDWLPEGVGGGVLISTRFGETTQIHRVDRPGAARRQLTFFDEPVTDADASPDPDVGGFLYTRDVGGSEFYQIYFFDLAEGTSTLMTDGESRNGAALWSNAGDRFAYYTTARNGTAWDIHVARPDAPGDSRAVLEEGGTWIPVDWSPDDSKLLVVRYVSANESYPHILDLESGDLTEINPRPEGAEPVAYGSAEFSADGESVYFTSDEGSEFKRLQRYDLDSGEISVLREPAWNVEGLAVSDDGSYLAYTVNEGGIDRVHLMDPASGEAIAIPEIPTGVVYGLDFSPDDRRLGFVLNSATSPSDVYAVELEGSSARELVRWTQSEVGGLDPSTFVAPELIRYPTFDTVEGEQRQIPAFYYRPEGPGPHPVVVDIHGGPESQELPSFNSRIQVWVNELGLAVLAPNVRGSAGYGKSYLELDNARKREDSVKDIGALLDWIDTRPELDSDRIGVYGGSYGGYMVLASLVHFDDRLRAGVDYVGISSFVTFLQNTKDYRRDLRRVEYGDERDPQMRAFLERISPLNRADEITTPLLVIQGANDPRVPQSESEQIVEEVRQNGGTVWYVLAKDEGHGFAKKDNRDYAREATALFFERYLVRADQRSAAGPRGSGR